MRTSGLAAVCDRFRIASFFAPRLCTISRFHFSDLKNEWTPNRPIACTTYRPLSPSTRRWQRETRMEEEEVGEVVMATKGQRFHMNGRNCLLPRKEDR